MGSETIRMPGMMPMGLVSLGHQRYQSLAEVRLEPNAARSVLPR